MSPPVQRDGKPLKKLNRRELRCVRCVPFLLFGRLLGTTQLDGFRPYRNHLGPIPTTNIQKAVAKAGITLEELDAHIDSLNKHLGWDIRVGARPEGQ